MDGNPTTRKYTYEIITTQYFQIPDHGAFHRFVQASLGLQTVEEDGAVRGIFRGVREEIFEGNLPGLWILIVQKLEKLD